MKFETVQNHFLSDVFGLLSFRNLASMATWRNDFSYVLSQESSLGPDSAVGEKSEKKKIIIIIGERSEPSSSLGRGKGAPPFPPPQSTAQLADSFYAVSLRFFFCHFSPQRSSRLQEREDSVRAKIKHLSVCRSRFQEKIKLAHLPTSLAIKLTESVMHVKGCCFAY